MDKLLRDKKAIVIFIAPALILFVVVLFIPICQSVYYSFCEYKGITAPKFIGLDNYKNLLKDKTMVIALKNSLFFLVFSCVTHLYNQGFKYNKYGYASAIGVVLLIMCLLVTGFINKFVKSENYEM